MAKHVFNFVYGTLYHGGEFLRLTNKRVVVKAARNMRGEGFVERQGALIVETDDPAATKREFERREAEFDDRLNEARAVVRLVEQERRAHAMASLKIAAVEETPADAK